MIVADLFARLGLQVDKASFSGGDKALGLVKKGLTAFAAVKVGQFFAGMIQSTADAADSSSKLAQKVGVSTEAIQELGYAAKLSDVDAGSLQVSLSRLAKGLQDFYKTGKGPAADAFHALGISAKELKGESLDQNFELIAEKLSKLPDGAKKTALAMDLFGRSGADLIPLLNGGQKGIVELRNEAEKLGIVVSGDTAKAFEQFNDDQTRVEEAMRGIKTQIVTAALPALQDLVTGVLEWVKANRDVIKSGIEVAVRGTIAVVQGLAIALAGVAEVIAFFANHAELARAVIIGISVAFGAMAVNAAAAWLATAAPVIAVIAGIAALVLAVEELDDHLDDIGDAVAAAFAAAGRAIAKFWSFLKSVPRRVLDAFRAMGRGIVDLFERAAQVVKSAFVSVINWSIDKVNWLLSKIPFVDATIGKIGTDDGGGGGPQTAAAAPAFVPRTGATATAPAPVAGNQVAIGDVSTTIQINGAGDPAAVANEARKSFDQNMDRVLNHARATVGGNGGVG